MHYPARGRQRERHTLCISSQAGCAVGCPFCATGELGFTRDLETAEIVDQVRHAARRLAADGKRLTNVVFMGMGEPLLNLDRVLESVDALNDQRRFGLGARHITVSTSGVVPGIRRLTALGPQFTLAVSLHAARDALRDVLVPLNRRWPVAEVVEAARDHARATGRRVSYETTMIGGVNDTPVDAQAMADLLRGDHAHVNLIPMNPVAHTPWSASPDDVIERFAATLREAGIQTTIRRNRGQEIGAACGQLAAERAGEPPPAVVARRRDRLDRRKRPRPPRRTQHGTAASGRRCRQHWVGGRVMATGRARIAVSILDADHSNMAYGVRRAQKEGADRIHIDVMDGHFVPNLTFGPKMIAGIRKRTKLPLDAHLMISDPLKYIDEFLDAGCDSVTFHVEVAAKQIAPTLEKIHAKGRAAGLAVKPKTPLNALEPYRTMLDIILVMTVEPGFGGQEFMRDVAQEKLLAARDYLRHKAHGAEVHVDGGINRESAEFVGGLGVDVLVVGSVLWIPGRNMGREIRLVKALADEGYQYRLNNGVPPIPRDNMITFAQLPRAPRDEVHAGDRAGRHPGRAAPRQRPVEPRRRSRLRPARAGDGRGSDRRAPRRRPRGLPRRGRGVARAVRRGARLDGPAEAAEELSRPCERCCSGRPARASGSAARRRGGRPRARRAARRRTGRRRGDRGRPRAPRHRAADLRRRGGPDEPVAGRCRRRGARRVASSRSTRTRGAAGVPGSPAPRPRSSRTASTSGSRPRFGSWASRSPRAGSAR